jgi:hypothetical protein
LFFCIIHTLMNNELGIEICLISKYKCGVSLSGLLLVINHARSSYINKPVSPLLHVYNTQVINHLAAQTLVLHQDRCSKNFIMYYEPATDFWTMLPWDVDSAFAIDRGLGGTPVQDWCTLSCEQFTSPLFCDRNHPQDVAAADPAGAYLLAPRQGPVGAAPAPPAAAVQAAGRRLKQTSFMDLIMGDGDDANEGGGGSSGGSSSSSASRAPTTSQGADEDLTRTSPPSFPESSFNYLVDAILAVPRTKEMYMRRLRTLMDQFIASGRLQVIYPFVSNSCILLQLYCCLIEDALFQKYVVLDFVCWWLCWEESQPG